MKLLIKSSVLEDEKGQYLPNGIVSKRFVTYNKESNEAQMFMVTEQDACIIHIQDPIFQYNTFIMQGGKDACNVLIKDITSDVEKLDEKFLINDNDKVAFCHGEFADKKSTSLIYLTPQEEKVFVTINLLSHEVQHLINNLFGFIGFEEDFKSQELRCYYTQFLTSVFTAMIGYKVDVSNNVD